MKALIAAARRFARDEEGITAIEYGLIAALMATAIGAAFGLIGPSLKDAFTSLAARINPTT